MAWIKVRNQESGAENGLWMERGTRGRRGKAWPRSECGSEGEERMKEDPGFCLVHWMDDGPIDQGGNPLKRAGLGGRCHI